MALRRRSGVSILTGCDRLLPYGKESPSPSGEGQRRLGSLLPSRSGVGLSALRKADGATPTPPLKGRGQNGRWPPNPGPQTGDRTSGVTVTREPVSVDLGSILNIK